MTNTNINEALLIILPFLVFWPLAAYLFWKWDIGGYRSESKNRKASPKK